MIPAGPQCRVLAASMMLAAAALGTPLGHTDAQDGESVALHVGVERADGTPVSGLGYQDFEVANEAGPCAVEAVRPAGQHLAMVLLVDLTRSQRTRGPGVRPDIERYLLPNLRAAHRLLVGAIGERTVMAGGFSANPHAWQDALDRVFGLPEAERTGPSPLWDAVDEAVAALAGEAGLRTVLMVTDGKATGNRLGADEVTARAIAAGVVVNAVNLSSRLETQTGSAVAHRTATIPSIVETTGGVWRTSYARTAAGGLLVLRLGPALAGVVRGLGERYEVRFACGKADGRMHDLHVRVNTPGLVTRAPLAYSATERR